MHKYFFVLGFLIISSTGFSQVERKFYLNFDDQKIDDPPWGSYYGPTGAVMGNWVTAYEGTHYQFVSPGHGGSGYCFSDIGCNDNDPHIVWYQEGNWIWDEVYVSYWIRYTCANLLSYPNIKDFYPHWGNNSSSGYVHFAMSGPGDGYYYSASDNNGNQIESAYPSTPGVANGQWHHMEFWIKFSTAQVRFWYDGSLRLDRDYNDSVWQYGSSKIYYLTAYKEDASGGSSGTDYFTRQMDDWEVWNGMPNSDPPPGQVQGIQVTSK